MKKAKQIHEQFLAITNTVNKGQRITLIFNQKKKKKGSTNMWVNYKKYIGNPINQINQRKKN